MKTFYTRWLLPLVFVPILLADVGCATLWRPNPLNSTPAKTPVLVGPVVGMNRNYHSGGFHTTEVY